MDTNTDADGNGIPTDNKKLKGMWARGFYFHVDMSELSKMSSPNKGHDCEHEHAVVISNCLVRVAEVLIWILVYILENKLIGTS